MYGSYGIPVAATLRHCTAYVQGFPLSGAGHQIVGKFQATISTDHGAIISPGEEVRLRYSGDFDHLVLIIKPTAVQDKLSALVGDVPCGPMRMTKDVDYGRTESAAQRRLVSFLAQELTRAELPRPALEELEQAIVISFLCTNDNNFSTLLKADPKDCAPREVRLAEEFIETNWREAVTIEKLVSITSTSARSLFRSFEKARGYSPMALVKRVRLRHARQMLANPEVNTSVTNVAYTCGFGNLSHFANDYRKCFGEYPSRTLQWATRLR
jgi:AraC-like DNA-binding protein